MATHILLTAFLPSRQIKQSSSISSSFRISVFVPSKSIVRIKFGLSRRFCLERGFIRTNSALISWLLSKIGGNLDRPFYNSSTLSKIMDNLDKTDGKWGVLSKKGVNLDNTRSDPLAIVQNRL